MDYLVSCFETLWMVEDELFMSFIAKLNTITNEAYVLVKKYKEKKLVKMLFSAYSHESDNKILLELTSGFHESMLVFCELLYRF